MYMCWYMHRRKPTFNEEDECDDNTGISVDHTRTQLTGK